MDPSGRELAFIVGFRKSGTSWLLLLLSSHPAIRSLRETGIFTRGEFDAERWTEELYSAPAWAMKRVNKAKVDPERAPRSRHDLSEEDQEALRSALRRSRSSDEFYRAFFEFYHSRLGPERYLLEKSPSHIPHVPEIRRVFPQAKLIAIARDGRDVVTSDLAFDEFLKNNELRAGVGRPFEERVRAWNESMQQLLRFRDRGEVYTVLYERLLEDPRAEVTLLLEFLGLDREPALVDRLVAENSFKSLTGREIGEEQRGDFFRRGGSGSWREVFGDAEKRAFKDLAGGTLVALGYEQGADW